MIWKPVIGYEDCYEINTYGEVRSMPRNGTIKKPRILKQYDSLGYKYVSLNKNDIGKKEKVHRLLAKTFIPNPYNKPCINHKNGNKSDNRIENLEWCTYSENNLHAVDTGLVKLGEKNTSSKLKNKEVEEIRKTYEEGKKILSEYREKYSQMALAKKYKVTQVSISAIVLNKTRRYG